MKVLAPIGRMLVRGGAKLQGVKLQAAKPKQLPDAISAQLGAILRPQAAYRWMLPQLAAITPQYIEMTLRGALAGNHVQAWELFDLMEDTWPRLVKNANQLKNEVVSELNSWKAKAYQEEGEPVSDSAKEKASLVNKALRGMRPRADVDENSFDGTTYDIMDAWLKGVAVLETNWENRRAGTMGVITAPRCTQWVHPVCYTWSMGGQLGLRTELNILGTTGTSSLPGKKGYAQLGGVWSSTSQQPRPTEVTEFPEHKFLIAIHKAKSGSPLGGALLRSLSWWWCAHNFSADWLLNLAQIWQLPFRWANYDPNASADTIAKICSMLENMGSNAWAAFPAGTTMELKESKQSGGNGPADNIMDRADKNCDLLVLGQTLTTDVSAKGGSRSQGEVHERVEGKIVQAAAAFVASVYNDQLIPSILVLNYGEGDDALDEAPRYESGEEDEGTVAYKREVVTGLSQHEVLSRVIANQLDLKQLVRDSGLPVNEEYTDPYVGLGEDAPGTIAEAHTAPEPQPQETPNSNNQPPDKNQAPSAKDKLKGAAKKAANAPSEDLVESGVDVYAEALAQDLEHLRTRLAALDQISNDEILRQRSLELMNDLERIAKDILPHSKAAQALAKVMNAALLTGLTEKPGH